MKHMGSTGRDKGKACVFSHITLVMGTKPGNPVKLNMFSFHFHPYPPFHLLLLLMKDSYYTVLKDSRREDHNPVHLPTSQIFKTLKHKIWCMCRRSLHPQFTGAICLSVFSGESPVSLQKHSFRLFSELSAQTNKTHCFHYVTLRGGSLTHAPSLLHSETSHTAHSQNASRKGQTIKSSGVYAKYLKEYCTPSYKCETFSKHPIQLPVTKHGVLKCFKGFYLHNIQNKN